LSLYGTRSCQRKSLGGLRRIGRLPLSLKDNRPSLEAEVADYFCSALATDLLLVKATVEKEHGHIETATRTPASKVEGSVYERRFHAGRA
jgi:hypothetical protein